MTRSADTITLYECVECEGRGQTAETVRHLITCTDRSELRALSFVLGDGTPRPLF